MATIAITGSAGGIGAATRERLEQDGHAVIGVDLRDAEVEVDLATPQGRAAMVDGVSEAADGVLDGLVAAAGLGDVARRPPDHAVFSEGVATVFGRPAGSP